MYKKLKSRPHKKNVLQQNGLCFFSKNIFPVLVNPITSVEKAMENITSVFVHLNTNTFMHNNYTFEHPVTKIPSNLQPIIFSVVKTFFFITNRFGHYNKHTWKFTLKNTFTI